MMMLLPPPQPRPADVLALPLRPPPPLPLLMIQNVSAAPLHQTVCLLLCPAMPLFLHARLRMPTLQPPKPLLLRLIMRKLRPTLRLALRLR